MWATWNWAKNVLSKSALGKYRNNNRENSTSFSCLYVFTISQPNALESAIELSYPNWVYCWSDKGRNCLSYIIICFWIMSAQVLSTQIYGSSAAYVSGSHRYLSFNVGLTLSKNRWLRPWAKFHSISPRPFRRSARKIFNPAWSKKLSKYILSKLVVN